VLYKMGDFPVKDYWKIYLNDEAKERVREIQDHLEENYESRSDFLRKKLKNEKALSIDERIERVKQEKREQEDKLERLKQIRREREQQDKLRDKRDLLKQKQEKLRKIQHQNKSESKIRKQVKQKILKDKRARFSEDEWLEKKSDKIDRLVESRLESLEDQDVDELVEDVQRLQEQVAELNGGEEDYFMDLEQTEVKAV